MRASLPLSLTASPHPVFLCLPLFLILFSFIFCPVSAVSFRFIYIFSRPITIK